LITLKAKPVIEKRRAELIAKVQVLSTQGKRVPHLSVVLVGDDPASQIYVSKKETTASLVGFTHESIRFPSDVNPEVVRLKVQELNHNSLVDGILIQRPLPEQFKESEVSLWVHPEKDVDCLHPENIGLLVNGNPRFNPCTPGGIMLLLDHYEIPVQGKVVCVIGRSAIVGKPLAALLLLRNATVIQIHRATENPAELCRLADVICVAAGSRGLVQESWVKPGAVIVDVGIHRTSEGKITGDVDVNSVASLPSAMSPVPGGVGPMTIQVLLENTFTSALRKR
jgi:methylenetetrahydrofolate dehydrogenase (NADP+)/methenyltetrahydrofolate cyclohydrolase